MGRLYTSTTVNIRPSKVHNFTLSHTGIKGKDDNILKTNGRVLEEPHFFL